MDGDRETRTLRVGKVEIKPGESKSIDLPVAHLPTHTNLTMPVRVIRGRTQGPTLFVCAAVHGDEINGVEVIRRLLQLKVLRRRLAGTLIAVPIVNVFGFIQQSRYLPDRRDLNRSFPGVERGSLAARLAHLFMTEIVQNSTHGIDLHTGAVHRTNLPHVRVNDTDEKTLGLATEFGAPLILKSALKDGSLRESVAASGRQVLMFEAGEALRFDEWAISAGFRGVVRVMQHLKMLPASTRRKKRRVVVSQDSSWLRAPVSGILRARTRLGAAVRKDQRLGSVADPFGDAEEELRAPFDGIVLGRTNLPLVYEGDALFHIARVDGAKARGALEEAFQAAAPDGMPFDPEEGPPTRGEGSS